MKPFIITSIVLLSSYAAYSQSVSNIIGTVLDKNTQELIIAADVQIISEKDTFNTQTDIDGKFKLEAPVGKYNINISNFNYDTFRLFNVNLNAGNAQIITAEMLPAKNSLEEVVIVNNRSKSARATDMVTPVSTQRLTSEEIKSNPGGNFDVSKVIQVLPGVAGGSSANRNDIIVRGGGPSENVYYLDGIEIPVLNHFQTQGASGGATGILNVSFIEDVQLTSSAFDSRYDNALASTFVIKQRNGNPDKFSGNLRLSGSEFAATFEGPLSKKTTFMASARRSYLKFLFQVLDLPIRPDYWDFQYKINHKIDKKTELTFIGVGAIDNFKIESPKDATPENEYIIRSNPIINQWNYTVGASLKRLVNNGYYTIALSRNMSYTGFNRYENNATEMGDVLSNIKSNEIENKLRIDVNKYVDGWKYSYGISGQYVKYDNDIFNRVQREIKDDDGNVISPNVDITSNSAIDFFKMGLYAHVSKRFFNESLLISGGVRTDMNTFTTDGMNPLQSLSPRLSISYPVTNKWDISASIGSYYKLPSYTNLGFRNPSGVLLNKDMKYINSIHYTLGTQFVPRNDFRFAMELFYKDYNNYPVSNTDGVSIANVGSEFGSVGNDDYSSNGIGRVYGAEIYVQQKLIKNLFYVVSLTLYKSEFSGSDKVLKPSSWDYGYMLATTLGYKFPKNWDLGLKYRISGGQPYTPFDLTASQLNYLTLGRGVLDYNRLNGERLPIFQQLDFRLDKKYNFKNTSLTVFVDFQNVFMYKTPSAPKYTFERNEDNTGFKTTDGGPLKNDGSNAVPYIIPGGSATIVPALGFIFEF